MNRLGKEVLCMSVMGAALKCLSTDLSMNGGGVWKALADISLKLRNKGCKRISLVFVLEESALQCVVFGGKLRQAWSLRACLSWRML